MFIPHRSILESFIPALPYLTPLSRLSIASCGQSVHVADPMQPACTVENEKLNSLETNKAHDRAKSVIAEIKHQ